MGPGVHPATRDVPPAMLESMMRRLGRLLVVVCLVGLCAAASWRIAARLREPPEARQARQAIAEGRYSEAEAHLARWLSRQPRSAEAHYLRAKAAFASGNPAQVEAELQLALTLGYPEEPVERLRAFNLVRSRRYAEAEPILVRLMARSSRPDPELDEATARVLLQTYKLDAARKVLARWIRDAPQDARPHLWMTEIDRRSQTDPAVTIGHYREALRRDPELAEARLGLADTLLSTHQAAEAATEFETHLKRHPDDPRALVGAGVAALEAGDEARAVAHLDRALSLQPDDLTALKERARIELARNDAAHALELLERAVRIDPQDAEAVHRRGLALARLGRTEEARLDQQRATELRQDEARIAELVRQVNLEPHNQDLRAEVAAWLFAHGRDEAGVRWANAVLAVDPGHPGANQSLADYHNRRGDPARANYYRLQARDRGSVSPGR
jgi:Flp pilus assembly protein TadD